MTPAMEVETSDHSTSTPTGHNNPKARKDYNEKNEVKAIKLLLKYFKKSDLIDKANVLEKELSSMGKSALHSSSEDLSNSDEDPDDQNTPNIGCDICLENLTDISDVDENEEMDKPRVARKRGKGFTIKKNSKGETQLHQACISGNTLLVTRLLSQGHPVNVRDNAGWLPLHEACIHGRKEIVQILLDNGAHVNDRGGTQCDGITPMYDAASNGYLDIVELLLNNGASPSIKTDNGETALNILVKWRKDNAKINPSDHIFYETICSRMHKSLEKIGESSCKTPTKNINKQSPFKDHNRLKNAKTNQDYLKGNLRRNVEISSDDILNKPSRHSWNSESEDSLESFSKVVKKHTFEDESSNSSVDMESTKGFKSNTKKDGVNQYKNAMKSLRNRRTISDTDSDQDKHVEIEKRKKGALLDADEVGEDWLENDLVQSHKRLKRNSFEISSIPKRKSNESAKTPRKSDELYSYNNLYKATSSENIITSGNIITNYGSMENSPMKGSVHSDSSEDGHLFQENIPPSNHNNAWDRCESMKKTLASKSSRKWKHQTSLIKSGFSRKKTSRPPLGKSDLKTMSPMKVMNSLTDHSEEPDSTTTINSNSLSGSERSLSYSNSNLFASCVTDEVPPNRPFFNQPTQQPVAVRVRIQDKLLLIPIMLDKVDSLTIDWLSKEVSRRYYNIEGVQPSLNLLTSDGAILAHEDPLSLVIGPMELQASITSWNLPPLGERYIECCAQFDTDIDDQIRSVLDTCQATHALSLPGLGLSPRDLQPLCKALNHQANLTSLMLSENSFGNEGLKYLIQCLPSLVQIRSINLSGNSIDGEGMKNFLYTFEKPNGSNFLNPLELDMSFNPLGDLGFSYLIRLTKHIRFKSLYLKACDISSQASTNVFHEANLQNIEILDLSMNDLSQTVLIRMLSELNPNIVTLLNLESLQLTGEVIANIFENGGCFSKLRKIDLSRCHLTDSDVTTILRSASKCEVLEEICLRYSTDLSVLSFKRLIQHTPSLSTIDLEGCHKIFKYLQVSETQKNWFTENQQCKLKCLKITADESNDNSTAIVHKLSQMWMNFLDNRACVETGLYGYLKLSEIHL